MCVGAHDMLLRPASEPEPACLATTGKGVKVARAAHSIYMKFLCEALLPFFRPHPSRTAQSPRFRALSLFLHYSSRRRHTLPLCVTQQLNINSTSHWPTSTGMMQANELL